MTLKRACGGNISGWVTLLLLFVDHGETSAAGGNMESWREVVFLLLFSHGELLGWLIAWLVDWLVGWLVGWFGRLIDGLFERGKCRPQHLDRINIPGQ